MNPVFIYKIFIYKIFIYKIFISIAGKRLECKGILIWDVSSLNTGTKSKAYQVTDKQGRSP